MTTSSTSQAVPAKPILVWDLPLRLCHWVLALLVAFAAITATIGGNAMDWHGRIGVAIAGILAFRVAWGVIGPTHARFASFVRGPGAIGAYLRGEWRGMGHNPLGALSVLGMLTVLSAQVAVGLFANDDIAFNGPLYALVSKGTSDYLTGLHHKGVWLVGLLVATHLAAIVYYVRIRKDDLLRPMITGYRVADNLAAVPTRGGGPAALIVAVAIGCTVAWMAAGGLLPPPPVPPAAGSPSAW
jgi:cytochrome b